MPVYQAAPLHPDQSSTGVPFRLVLQQQPSPLEALEDAALLTPPISPLSHLSSSYPSSLPLHSSASC